MNEIFQLFEIPVYKLRSAVHLPSRISWSASKIYLYINFLLLPIIFPSLGKNKVYMFYSPPSPDADSPEGFKLASIGLFRLQVKFVSGMSESYKNSMIMDGNQYYIIGKFGVDGSGSHKIRHQLVKNDIASQNIGHVFSSKTSSFLLSFYC